MTFDLEAFRAWCVGRTFRHEGHLYRVRRERYEARYPYAVRKAGGKMMREATENEYAIAYSRATQHDRASGKRYASYWSKDRGTPVCERHETLKRGKVVTTVYMVNPDFLPEQSK